jgi:hypothetical protein
MKKTMMTIAIIGIAMMTTMANAASPAADLAVKINGLSADPFSLFTPLGDGTAITEFNGGATAGAVYHVANRVVGNSDPGNTWSGASMRVGAGNGYAYQDFAGSGNPGNTLYRYQSGIGWDAITDTGANGGLDRYWGLGNGGVVSEYGSHSWYIDPAGKVHAHGTEGSATVAGGLVTAGNGYLYKHYANLGQYGNSLYRFNANGNGGTGEWSNLGTEGGADRMTGLGNGMILNHIDNKEYLIRLDGTASNTNAPAGISNLRGGGGFAFGNVGSVMHVFDSSTETWTAIDDGDGGNWGVFASAPVEAVVMDTGWLLTSLGLGTTFLINPQGGPGFQIFDTGHGSMGGSRMWDSGNGIAYFDQGSSSSPGALYMLDTTSLVIPEPATMSLLALAGLLLLCRRR